MSSPRQNYKPMLTVTLNVSLSTTKGILAAWMILAATMTWKAAPGLRLR
jgi:hypothetical protein